MIGSWDNYQNLDPILFSEKLRFQVWNLNSHE